MDLYSKYCCAICGLSKFKDAILDIKFDDIKKFRGYFKLLPQNSLKIPKELNEFKHYKSNKIFDFVLHNDGINYENETLISCEDCIKIINSETLLFNNFLSNGFYRQINNPAYWRPELNLTELNLVQIDRPYLHITALRLYKNNLKSGSVFKISSICYRQNIKELSKILPRSFNTLSQSIQVIFTGIAKLPIKYLQYSHSVDINKIILWLSITKKININYFDIEFNFDNLKENELENETKIPKILLNETEFMKEGKKMK